MTATTSNSLDLGIFSEVCRGCLAEGVDMKNMHEWGLSDDFTIFTDVPLERSPCGSELLCASCEEQLISCKRFRMQCQRSDLLLKDTVRKKITEEETIDKPDSQAITIDKKFTDKNLILTVTTANTDEKIYFPCPYNCQNSYIKQKDLQIHLKKCHKKEDIEITIQYKCPYSCEKTFNGRKYLNQHLLKVHKNENILCKNCSLKFYSDKDFLRHLKVCNVTFLCGICDVSYRSNERLLVHLKRRHPDLHMDYKTSRKVQKTLPSQTESKKDMDYLDNLKRSLATQTVKNDIILNSWTDKLDRDLSCDSETQTAFEDLLSLKSNEEYGIFFNETETQTFDLEFGLSRKETITSQTQTKIQDGCSKIKETQTCLCHFDSQLTSTETQTNDSINQYLKSDVMFSSAQTQTCFENKEL